MVITKDEVNNIIYGRVIPLQRYDIKYEYDLWSYTVKAYKATRHNENIKRIKWDKKMVHVWIKNNSNSYIMYLYTCIYLIYYISYVKKQWL